MKFNVGISEAFVILQKAFDYIPRGVVDVYGGGIRNYGYNDEGN